MTKITFEVHVEEGRDAAEMVDALKDIVQDFGFPEYLIGAGEVGYASSEKMAESMPQGIINLDPVRSDETFAEYVGRALPDFFHLDTEEEDETDPCLLLPGAVVELAGGVFQVFSIDATGRVVLDELEEVDTDDEGAYDA
jgi:hypothetical protein